jgi:chromosome partitioning protein
MGITIAIANQKGGTGKTTTATNLATGLALKGQKVLLIDFDAQMNSSDYFGLQDAEVSVVDMMEGSCPAEDAVYETDVPNLYLIGGTKTLKHYEATLLTRPAREKILLHRLASIKNAVDYILIDCAGDLGTTTLNALTAADYVLMASQPEEFSYCGVEDLLHTVNIIQEDLNPKLEILGVLLTMYQKTIKHHREIENVFFDHPQLSHKLFDT